MKTSQHVRMLDAWAGEAVVQARCRLREGVRDGERGGGRADARARGGRGVLGQARRGALRAAAHRRGGSARKASTTSCWRSLRASSMLETFAVAANTAHEALAGEQGAIDALGSAIAALDGAARSDAKLGEFAEALREAGYVLEDMARETRRLPRGRGVRSRDIGAAGGAHGFAARAPAHVRSAHGRRAGASRRSGRPRIARGRCRRARTRGAAGARPGRRGARAGGVRAGRRARRGRPAVRRSRDGADGSPGNGRGAAGVRPRTARARSVDEGGPAGRGVPVPTWRRHAGASARASHRAARSAASCWP